MSNLFSDGSLELTAKGGLTYLKSPLLDKIGFIEHAFLTRRAIDENGREDELDWRGETGSVSANSRARLAACFGMEPLALVTVRQVHGDQILVIDGEPGPFYDQQGFDALVTAQPGLALSIRTADCVPVLLVDPVRQVVGALHAGWRGAGLGIAAGTIDVFRNRFGSDPADIVALLGPSIGSCCYQVDRPVYTSLAGDRRQEKFFSPDGPERWRLALAPLVAAQLEACGLRRELVLVSRICTSCSHDLFFSHRARGEWGRQLNFVMLVR